MPDTSIPTATASEVAVFVDGSGHTREMAVPTDRNDIRIPVPQHFDARRDPALRPTRDDDFDKSVEFTRLGRLPKPDNRRVFGFVFSSGPQFGLWFVEHPITAEMMRESVGTGPLAQRVRDVIERHIQSVIDGLGSSLVVRLYDYTTFDEKTGIYTRLLMGVARREDRHPS
jgi:hypothetical protein